MDPEGQVQWQALHPYREVLLPPKVTQAVEPQGPIASRNSQERGRGDVLCIAIGGVGEGARIARRGERQAHDKVVLAMVAGEGDTSLVVSHHDETRARGRVCDRGELDDLHV